MKHKVIVLVPMKPTAPKALVECFHQWFTPCLCLLMREYDVTVVTHAPYFETDGKPHPDRASRIAELRNQVVEEFVMNSPTNEHATVIWVDADIIGGCSPTVLADLVKKSTRHRAIIAPSVFLQPGDGTPCDPYLGASEHSIYLRENHKLRWYDTAGFVHNDKKATNCYPWLLVPETPTGIVEVNGSVGCLYAMPAKPFFQGVRFDAPQNKEYTEHYVLCQEAFKKNVNVLWDHGLFVVHANLPLFGEKFH